MPETPAEELHAAAAKLRETAAEPLACIEPVIDGDLDEWTKFYARDWSDAPEGDGPWIALMTPELAEPLAQLLEDVASDLADFDEERDGCECTAANGFHQAIRVARVINGGA